MHRPKKKGGKSEDLPPRLVRLNLSGRVPAPVLAAEAEAEAPGSSGPP
jgi:hypothetical protein